MFPDIYTIITHDVTLALEKRSEDHLFGYTLQRSEYPKLFILETQKGRIFTTKTKLSVEDLDSFAYIKSKFIYLEKHEKSYDIALRWRHQAEVRVGEADTKELFGACYTPSWRIRTHCNEISRLFDCDDGRDSTYSEMYSRCNERQTICRMLPIASSVPTGY